MSKHTRTFGGTGLAVVLLAAAALSACTEYLEPRKGPPVVIGVLVADVNFNELVPVDPAGTCSATTTPPMPYPEPDPTKIAPGLCGGINSLCPVACYPPRTGPAYAPTYTGGDSVTYACDPAFPDARCTGGVYTASIPAGGVYTLTQVRSADFTDASGNTYTFAQIRILFNILMDGASIQPDPAACAAPPGTPGLNITANGLADNANWTVCYAPNSATPAWGASMVLTHTPPAPALPNLAAATTYHVTGTVSDQDGNALPIDVTVTTQ